MKKLLVPAMIFLIGIVLAAQPTHAVDEPKEVPKQKADRPSFGDRDDAVLQNRRYLKIRNETEGTLTVFLQFRAPQAGAWTWVPADPAASTESLSFEIEAGKELDVTHKDDMVAASRMRIWATSPTEKWLKYKAKDIWLVPERTEDGEHVYIASGIETFSFVFSSSKDKGVIPGDSDMPGEQNLPTEGDNVLPPPPEIPWDILPDPLPPNFMLIRDLAVLPVFTIGTNATVRVKNLGHFNVNLGRRLMVQKLAPGSVPEDRGPIGPLFHYSVKTFYLVGISPGNYIAYISPSDDPPYHFNEKKPFTITALAFSDTAVLPVTLAGGKAWVKVKNVGTAPLAAAQHLKIQKLPAGVPVDHGPVGALGVNAIKMFPGIVLPAGVYTAFVTPGDAAPHQFNDKKIFIVPAAMDPDFDVLPVSVVAGKATVKIKNIGTAAAPGGAHLKIMKLPGGPIVDHGALGVLPVNAIKTFAMIPLAPGSYKAFVSPGDAPPHHGNDSEIFFVPGVILADLDILSVTVAAGKATIKIKNIGTADAPAGAHLKTQKIPGGLIVDHGVIGALPVNGIKTFAMIPLAPGNYKAFVSPGDAPPHHVNDSQLFIVTSSADLQVSAPVKMGGVVRATIKNNGPGMYAGGARTWHLEKFVMGAWMSIPTVGGHVIPALVPGADHTVQGTFTGNGTYRIRITPGDAHPVNDTKSKMLP